MDSMALRKIERIQRWWKKTSSKFARCEQCFLKRPIDKLFELPACAESDIGSGFCCYKLCCKKDCITHCKICQIDLKLQKDLPHGYRYELDDSPNGSYNDNFYVHKVDYSPKLNPICKMCRDNLSDEEKINYHNIHWNGMTLKEYERRYG